MYLSRLFRSVNPAALNQASAVGFNRVARFSSSRYFNYADDSGVSSKMEEANVQHQQRASQRAGVGSGSGETLRPNEAAYASQGQNVGKGGNLSTNPNFRMGGSELGGPKYGESFSSTVGMDPHFDKSNSALDAAPNNGNSRTMSREASQDFGSSGSKRSGQFSSSASVGQGGSVEGVQEEHNRREGFRPRGAESHGDQNMANPTPSTNDMRSNVSQRQKIEDQKPLTGNYRANNSSSSSSSFSSGQDSQQQMGKDRHAWGENEPARDYHFYDSSSAPSFSQQSSSSSSGDASSLASKVVNVVEGAKDIAVDMAKDAKELAKDAWQAVNRSAHENQSLISGSPLVSKKLDQGAQAREGQHQQHGDSFIERAKEAWHTLKGDNQPHSSSQQNFSGNQQGRYQNQQYQQHDEGVVERTKEAWETLKGDNQQYRGQQDEGLIDRAKEAWETLKGDSQSSSSNFRNDRIAPNDYIKTTGEQAKEGMQKIKEDAKEMLEKSKEAFQNEDVTDRAKEAWATLKGEGSHQNESLKERAKDAWETIKDGSKSEQYKSKDFSASSSSSSGMNSSQGYKDMLKGEGNSEEDLTERAKEAWKTIRGEDKDKASFSQKKDYSQSSKSSKDFGQQSSFQDKDKLENRSFEEKGSRGYLGSSGDISNQSKQSQDSRITADKEKFDDLAYSIPELKKTTEAWKEEVRKALGEKEKKSKDSESSFQESEARGYGGSLGEIAGQKDSKKYSEASDKKVPERHSNKKDSKAEQDKSSSSAKRKAV